LARNPLSRPPITLKGMNRSFMRGGNGIPPRARGYPRRVDGAR
jgi:hypothetical protein